MQPREAQRCLIETAKISGWLSQEAGMLLGMIDSFQKQAQIYGDIFEIGVHHGKSSILFSRMLRPSEDLSICDVFDRSRNPSVSGSGDERTFFRNMRRLAPKATKNVHRCLSSELTSQLIGSGFRIFHIDGGHNTDEVINDLRLAASVLSPEGVIILDDPFRDEWPGVTEGLVRFLDNAPRFQTIAVGFNKLLLADASFTAKYKSFLSDPQRLKEYGLGYPYERKIVPFASGTLDVYFLPTRYIGVKKSKVQIARIIHRSQWIQRTLARLR